ncbi:dihydrofolate reductase [Ferviditalea candida]|uniref:Dihydrofolate reductase n=1 Tax=Ferviditalea candida TaxID=3108399 RepID=A0ABU5ZGE3_9BACL|nr:dihydrofolate reductase [Paenibacillaceae bacterium T2]
MSISIIVAMDRNRVIGKDNKLPWRLPAELAYFKKVTMGHPVIMGRKTHQSIGRPLPGRNNIVMTRDSGYQAEGCQVVHSIDESLRLIGEREAFVIGGAEMIRLFFSHTSKLYITWIDHEFEGDTFFPDFDETQWTLVSEKPGITDDNNPYTYFFRVYKRNH